MITTEACRRFMEDGRLPDGLMPEALDHLAELESATLRSFGGGPKPLLVSVRSGAPVSMPGMTDTVLNLGLNEAAAVALAQVSADHIRQSERPRFDEDALAAARDRGALVATGIGASPGHVSGKVVLDPDRAVALAEAGEQVLLARPTTSPLDLHGMLASVGILTAMGGATSHAAVVARGAREAVRGRLRRARHRP